MARIGRSTGHVYRIKPAAALQTQVFSKALTASVVGSPTLVKRVGLVRQVSVVTAASITKSIGATFTQALTASVTTVASICSHLIFGLSPRLAGALGLTPRNPDSLNLPPKC